MKWREARRSDNVVGGRRGGGGIKLGIGGIAIVIVLGLLFGKDPLQMLGVIQQLEQPASSQGPAADDETTDFVRAILGETEDVWTAVLDRAGVRYVPPKLVLFSGRVQTACGGASSATGPFYCPSDQQVYLDTSFFDEMKARLGGGGDFAYAYVIAHEIGHHVQNLTGVFKRAQSEQARGVPMNGATGLSVREELQADCYAGVWANRAEARHKWLERGDIEQALSTATAIGDDRLQQQAQGEVVPDSFTHGTSEQRVRWFKRGFATGEIGQCDTFSAKTL
ncbi:KPN_02809 family neutral zinc metallopeptidase [Solimonas marina]|uniref:Neutral zinc metallopeptidase n=1 Tax=Solimonas marina TaxID=2714601 RepID=A0A970B5R8_9GAMM|nr:neutral zinc metallopeptidase [Solimonas marina]NKF21875.1 neutral zinc metallopeptidase [Solimonas marina]